MTKTLEDAFKIVPIEDCIPNERNPNKMGEKEMQKLKQDIDLVGDNEQHPILVRPHPKNKGKYQIIDGFHRWTVMNELGFEEIIVNIQELSDKEARIKTITANKFRGEADQILMGELLLSLKNDFGMTNEDIDAIIGFSEGEIKNYEEMIDFDFGKFAKEEIIPDGIADETIPVELSLNVTPVEQKQIMDAVSGLKAYTKLNLSTAKGVSIICAYFNVLQSNGLLDVDLMGEAQILAEGETVQQTFSNPEDEMLGGLI